MLVTLRLMSSATALCSSAALAIWLFMSLISETAWVIACSASAAASACSTLRWVRL